MNNERAIELLHRLQDEQFDGIHGDERREALDMAVRALEGDGDTIYRQDAIDALERTAREKFNLSDEYNHYLAGLMDGELAIKELPTIQPVATDTNVGDTISRRQAIDALDKHIDTFDAIDTNYLCGLRTAMSILKEMPSAQPETHDKRTETHACDLSRFDHYFQERGESE